LYLSPKKVHDPENHQADQVKKLTAK
jgi:hypothetical protein